MMQLHKNNTYFTSDLHFSHRNICEFAGRPFSSVEEMDNQLINNWNEIVPQDGVVFSLGDFAFCKIDGIKKILSKLNGSIYMILGNHDKEIIKYSDQLINEGFVKEIVPYKEIKIDNQHINLFHYGARVWNKSHYGSWHLFGHSHNSLPPYGKSVDVGADSTWITGKAEYKPFSFEQIKNFMDNRDIAIADRHEMR